jgi:hypothetical protein
VARSSAHPLKRHLALVLAIVVAGGFMAIPLAAMAGRFPVVETPSATAPTPAEAH